MKLPPFFLLPLLCLMAATSRADVTLVRAGQPVAKIYRAATASPALDKAVRDLNYHLQKMSGVELEVVMAPDATSVRGPALVLGDLAVQMGAKPQKTSRSGEGFRILATADRLLIGGQSDLAVQMGVYELLGKLGCDWVMPGTIGEIIPQRATVEIAPLDESQAPDFDTHTLWYRGSQNIATKEDKERFGLWLQRQKAGDFSFPPIATGGHLWNQFIRTHRDEFEKDPTMLALVRAADGTLKRAGPQLESTHPRVIELWAQDIRDFYTKRNWPKDQPASFGVGPADGLGYSLSAESLAAGAGRVDPIVGELDRTDELVLFANKILEKLGPDYPNVYLNFYSYSVHADYPARYRPKPHIVPIFAPINFSRFHSLLDSNSKTQAYYRAVVEQWGKLHQEQGNILQYRGYNWNLAENMLPYTKLKIWGDELPFYHQMGFSSTTVEATKAWSINGPSDYLYMKLAWNSSLKWQDVLKTYCARSFGTGAAPMEHYFLRLVERQHGSGQEAGSYYGFGAIYDRAWVKESQTEMQEALRLAQTPDDKTRVGYIAGGIEALDLYLSFLETSQKNDFAATQMAYDAMNAHWQKQYDLNPDLVAREVPQYLKRFLGRFVEDGVKYSSGDYHMVAPLPDELPTSFDPNQVGERMNLPAPEINDQNWVKTKTYSATWDAQGLSGLRSGAVWYRHHFSLSAEQKNKPIGLFLGGFEDEARVWLNGHYIGTSGKQFSVPAVFDLSENVRTGDNLLVVQVVRNGNANEIGLGGLLRPSFLFSGPKLTSPAPLPFLQRRILPGGELGAIEK